MRKMQKWIYLAKVHSAIHLCEDGVYEAITGGEIASQDETLNLATDARLTIPHSVHSHKHRHHYWWISFYIEISALA